VKLVEAAVHSLNGGFTILRYGWVTRAVKLNKGEMYRWNGQWISYRLDDKMHIHT
jgi:hypothetical protein